MHFSFCFKVVVTILKGASQLIKKKIVKKVSLLYIIKNH
jgi:hypothetical protein